MLPSGRTVSRHVENVVSSEKAALVKQLAGIKRFGVTTDGWTHETTTTPYITVTLHYIDEVLKFTLLLILSHHFHQLSLIHSIIPN